jgi:membrane fusion protein, copper/silver efflux system
MKRNWRSRLALASFSVLLVLASCNRGSEQAVADTYICPMHPTVISDRPGTCPVCGMDLVRKGKPGEEVKITAELNYLLKPTNAMVISSIRTVTPVQKQFEFTTTANGVITYDTRRSTSIPIRFGGRVEKLLIKYNFQAVRKGQKLLEIYSPELLNAQRELLYLVRSDKDNTLLIDGAKEKLRLLGLTDSQVDQLISTGKENISISVFSPVDGYVVEDAPVAASTPVKPSAGSTMDNGMTATSTPGQDPMQFQNTALTVREGMYLSAGQAVFKVVNTDKLWAEFDVYQRDVPYLKVNDRAQLTFEAAPETVDAKVDMVQPFIKSGESFAKVRVYLPNADEHYRVGQLVKASFGKSSDSSLWIPSSARLDLGTREMVFVKRRGVFRPKEIVTGRQSDEWIEVSKGLEAGDSVAYNAQFMIDSEGFIKVRN